MSDLGAISSYALAVQNIQLAAIKNTAEMQQQVIDILLDPESSRSIAPSEFLGRSVDISV